MSFKYWFIELKLELSLPFPFTVIFSLIFKPLSTTYYVSNLYINFPINLTKQTLVYLLCKKKYPILITM